MNAGRRPSQISTGSSRTSGKKSILMKPGKKTPQTLGPFNLSSGKTQLKSSSSQGSILIQNCQVPTLPITSGQTPRQLRTEFASIVTQSSPPQGTNKASGQGKNNTSIPTSNKLTSSQSQRQLVRPSLTSNTNSNRTTLSKAQASAQNAQANSNTA